MLRNPTFLVNSGAFILPSVSTIFSSFNVPEVSLLFIQVRFRSSAFKPVTPKNFSSMQNLYPSSKLEDADHGLSNGLHRGYAEVPKAVSSSSSSSSPSRHGGLASSGNKVFYHIITAVIQSVSHDSMSIESFYICRRGYKSACLLIDLPSFLKKKLLKLTCAPRNKQIWILDFYILHTDYRCKTAFQLLFTVNKAFPDLNSCITIVV